MSATPVRYRPGDGKRPPLTLPPMPRDISLPEARSQVHWKGRLAVRLGVDEQTRRARGARVAFRRDLLADLKAAGLSQQAKGLDKFRAAPWLDRVKISEVSRAREFVGANDFTLARMTDDQFKDGANAVRVVFSNWASERLDEVDRYELPQMSSPRSAVEGLAPSSQLIPDEVWRRVALVELYRIMDSREYRHGAARDELAGKLLERLESVRLKLTSSTEQADQIGDEEGVRLAGRRSLGADPAVLTLARIRAEIEALPELFREGVEPAASVSPARAPVHVEHHVLLSEPPPPGSSPEEQSAWWSRNRGGLLAFFVGKPDIKQLIEVLRSGGADEAQLARASELLRSEGQRSDAFEANWAALKSIVRHVNTRAQHRQADMARLQQGVPLEQVHAFARAALGARFEAEPGRFEKIVYRNRIACELHRRVAEMAAKAVDGHPIGRTALGTVVDDVLTSVKPEPTRIVRRSVAPDQLPSPTEPRRDTKSSAASRAQAAAYAARSISVPPQAVVPASPVSAARSPSRASLAPKGLAQSLNRISLDLDKAERQRSLTARNTILAEVRTDLVAAKAKFDKAVPTATTASPREEPVWVSPARKQIAGLKARCAEMSKTKS